MPSYFALVFRQLLLTLRWLSAPRRSPLDLIQLLLAEYVDCQGFANRERLLFDIDHRVRLRFESHMLWSVALAAVVIGWRFLTDCHEVRQLVCLGDEPFDLLILFIPNFEVRRILLDFLR